MMMRHKSKGRTKRKHECGEQVAGSALGYHRVQPVVVVLGSERERVCLGCREMQK